MPGEDRSVARVGRDVAIDGEVMDQFHLFTPEQAAIARATAAGWVVAMVVLRRGWLEIVSWFLVGQLSSYYWTDLIARYFGFEMNPGAVGFLIGAGGMFVWTALFTVGTKLSQDPLGTIQQIWRIRKGGEP